EIEAEVRAAAERAAAQAPPDPAKVTQFVFADAAFPVQNKLQQNQEPIAPPKPNQQNPRRINMVQAVQHVLDIELTHNPKLLLFGEDVGPKGGVHTATMGLQTKHGAGRVFDTSLSEEGIIGRAVGMALAGLRPVPEIQFRKYADPAMEQLNNIGTLRWRTNNNFAAPVVVRMPVGFGRKVGDPWHSVTNEAMYAHAVGWQIAYPSNAEDCVGLLRSALRNDNPTFFFEHRALLDAVWARRPYPGDDYVIPFGKGRILMPGSALTVVTWGAMAERCEIVVCGINVDIELIDLRTIMPWDKEMVLKSVRKTSKCLIVHEDIGVAGFGAEIAAIIASEAFLDLDGPVERLTMPAIPVPFNVPLMNSVMPSNLKIREKIEELLAF
ncbi:MAG: hypothetical protein KAG66_20730, partial [Methylococcales bacterium]|nr:hypothetical protein [Methylococcales bacterium]